MPLRIKKLPQYCGSFFCIFQRAIESHTQFVYNELEFESIETIKR